MAKRAFLVFATVVAAAVLSLAQVSTQGTTTSAGSFSRSASFGVPPPFAFPVVTGAPYSGEEVSENLKLLTDGTRITQKMMGRKVWRDFDGRTRTERPFGMGPNQAVASVVIEITDPVAGYKYTLDTQNKVAHRQALPAQGSRPTGTRAAFVGSSPGTLGSPGAPLLVPTVLVPAGAVRSGEMSAVIPPPSAATPSPANAPARPRLAQESLGRQTIDGVFVEGTRLTITYPVGMRGNDREFSAVTESWMSPDLKLQILSKTNDPSNGENTFRIQDLSRTPPDAMLFAVPPDYTVVDEAGAFTINYTGQ